MKKASKIVSIIVITSLLITILSTITASAVPDVSVINNNLVFKTTSQKATSSTVFRTLGWSVTISIPVYGTCSTTVAFQQTASVDNGDGTVTTSFSIPLVGSSTSIIPRLQQDNPSAADGIANYVNTGGIFTLYAIQTVLNSVSGNTTGSIDQNGKYVSGFVSYDYNTISNAEPWTSQTKLDLQQYFGLTVPFQPQNVPVTKTKTLDILCVQVNADGSRQSIYSSIYNLSDRLEQIKTLNTGDTWGTNYTAPSLTGYTYTYGIVNGDGSLNGTHDLGTTETANFTYNGADQQYMLFCYSKDPESGGVTVKYVNQDTGADVAPADNYPTVTPGSYTYTAKTVPGFALQGSSTQTITVAAGQSYTVTFNYKGTIKPTCTLSAPTQVTVGDDVNIYSYGNSTDPTVTTLQGTITITGGTGINGTNPIDGAVTQGKSCTTTNSVWFSQVGTYTVNAFVIDSNNNVGTATQISIKVVAPVPIVNIVQTGTLKENRKVIIDASSSTGGSKRFPVDWTSAVWTIAPVGSASMNDVRIQSHTTGSTNGTVLYDPSKSINSSLNGLSIFDMEFKKAGQYQVTCTLRNTYGNSSTNTTILNIVVDTPPVAGFTVPTVGIRDHFDPNKYGGLAYGIWTPTDTGSGTTGCYSTDGDSIDKIAWFYIFDFNNNNSYLDDKCYVFNASTQQWTYIGLYKDISTFDVDSIPVGTLHSVSLEWPHDGDYYFGVKVREAFGQEYIPQFTTVSDKKTSILFY